MRSVIEQDVCAGCAHLRPSKPLPIDKCVPPFGIFDIQCACAKGWPYTGVFVSANARSECPEFTTSEQVMQPTRPWPFPAGTPLPDTQPLPPPTPMKGPK